MSMFADAYISTLGYQRSLGSAKCAKVLMFVCFLENRDIKKGAMIAGGTKPEAKLGFFQGWVKFSTLTLLRLPNRFQAGEIGVDCFLVSM